MHLRGLTNRLIRAQAPMQMKSPEDSHDNDIHKGAVEDDQPKQEHNTSMRGQLGHRKKGEMIDGNDSDYPEPGENPEHT